jgi:hypothetical protein
MADMFEYNIKEIQLRGEGEGNCDFTVSIYAVNSLVKEI